jgi:hypothetical protein
MRTRWIALVGATAAMLVPAASAGAASFTVEVTTTGDPGPSGCSLRDAVAAVANDTDTGGCNPVAAGTEDRITFDEALDGQAITLDGGGGTVSLNDADPLTLLGNGMSETIVAAGAADRVFTKTDANLVEIEDLTIRDGSQSGEEVRGGCIFNQGQMSLIGVRVTNCTATAANSTGNAYADGSAIGNVGTLSLVDSLVDDNETSATNTTTGVGSTEGGARGAIYSEGGVSLEDTTVSGNEATAVDTDDGSGFGDRAVAVGGLAILGDTDNEVLNSTFGGNGATATESNGQALAVGGVYAQVPVDIELSTIAENEADPGGPGAITFPAGGALLDGGPNTIRSSTVALNGPTILTDLDGANIVARGGPTTLSNTIIADPLGGGQNCLLLDTVTSEGFNDDYTPDPDGASCLTTPLASDLTSNPLLAAGGLANNGGPTETIALQPASPVIDQGSNVGDDDETIDQRGLTRPVDFTGLADAMGGNGTDIGAYELQLACAGQATPTAECATPTPPGPVVTPPSSTPPPAKTGRRAKALKKCKKKEGDKRKKCVKRAKKLPA